MIITKEQNDEMLEAAKPLMKWLNENCHPHCTISIDQNTIKLVEDIACNKADEFLKGK
jgi:hypothetical protein